MKRALLAAVVCVAGMFPLAVRADERADTLAGEIIRASGGAALPQLVELRFTYNVEQNGKLIESVQHDWHVRAGYDKVQTNDAWMTCSIPERGTDPFAVAAYRRWVNDAEWLFPPVTLRNPGVVLGYRGREGELDVLHVEMAGTSNALQRSCNLYVDPKTHLVQRMDYSPTPGTTITGTWSNYRTFGGLTLATENRIGDKRIYFTDIRAVRAHDGLFAKVPVRTQFTIIFLCIAAWVIVWGFLVKAKHVHAPGPHGAPRGNSLDSIKQYWSWRGPP